MELNYGNCARKNNYGCCKCIERGLRLMNNRLNNKPHCPKCERQLDGFAGVSEGAVQPQVGDVTICAYCSCVLEFIDTENGLGFTEASVETIMEAGLLDISRAHNIVNEFRNEG